MKKILSLILIALAGFSFTGCDDLLDAVPKDKLTPPYFFKSESELSAYSIVFYTAFPTGDLYVSNDDHYTKNNMSDEATGSRQIPASGGGWSWGALRNINVLLENVNNCPDAAVRIKYEALARFFRAYFYYNKVVRFGDVPWYDKPVGSADEAALKRPRDSREFIMGKIVDDLNFAIDNLPSNHSTYEITKWTAMALKSRIMLFEGTFRKYHANDVFLQTLPSDAKPYTWYLNECATVSKELIQTGGYSLHTSAGPNKSYFELFHTMEATELTDEVILAQDFNSLYGKTHDSGNTMNTGSKGHPSATKKFIASYLMKDGSRFTDPAVNPTWETMSFNDECQNRDPRLAQSFRTPGYSRMGETVTTSPDFLVTMSGYHPDKYVMTKEQDTNNASYCDLILFRLGEVMLNYAEAMAELGTIVQGDLDLSVNKLRRRVGMPDMNLAYAKANPDPFLYNDASVNPDNKWGAYQSPILLADANLGVILEIRRERAVELAQEGYRYNDLMRWKEGLVFKAPFYGIYLPGVGVYDIDNNGSNDVEIIASDGTAAQSVAPVMKLGSDVELTAENGGFIEMHKFVPRKWDENRDYLYPVPTNERNLTGGAVTQNPGWPDNLDF